MTNLKTKLCKSCGGPLSDFDKNEIINPDYCPYCVDEKGKLKSYKDIIDGMISYIKNDHKEITPKNRIITAQKWLSEAPAWKNKFIDKDIVIEDIREQNFKDIPKMSDKYSCTKCMFYQNGKHSKSNKYNWFIQMQTKYGSCGKILYYKGIPCGYTQFGPKKEFSRLETFSKNSTKTDAWYICCLQNNQGKKRFEEILLDNVLKDLKKRDVKKVQACGRLNVKTTTFSGGDWITYKKLGFKEIRSDKDFKVGEKIL